MFPYKYIMSLPSTIMSCPVYTLMSKTAQSLEGGGKQSNNQTKDYIVANHKFFFINLVQSLWLWGCKSEKGKTNERIELLKGYHLYNLLNKIKRKKRPPLFFFFDHCLVSGFLSGISLGFILAVA